MLQKPQFIAIGLCTYKRPILLELALKSIANLLVPKDIQIIIIIVDNDSEGSARSIVKSSEASLPFPIEYNQEANKGIPFARNKVLERALAKQVDAIAFLDDDDQADKNWLVQLLKYYTQAKLSVVTGPQHCLLPPATPKWARKSEFFRSMSFPTGTKRPWAATHNVMFSIELVKKIGLRFDTNFLTGEDQLFFMQAVRAGADILWVQKASVSETPSIDRISLKWILLRNFKYSSQGNRLYRKLFGWRGIFQAFWRGALYLGYSSSILLIWGLIVLPYDRSVFVKALAYFSRGIGWFAGFGMKITRNIQQKSDTSNHIAIITLCLGIVYSIFSNACLQINIAPLSEFTQKYKQQDIRPNRTPPLQIIFHGNGIEKNDWTKALSISRLFYSGINNQSGSLRDLLEPVLLSITQKKGYKSQIRTPPSPNNAYDTNINTNH